jgi:integrase
MASMFKIGESYVIEHRPVPGRVERVYTGTADLTTAQEIKAAVEQRDVRVRHGLELPFDRKRQRITEHMRRPIEEHLDAWERALRTRGKRASTVTRYRQTLDRLVKTMQVRSLADLTRACVEEYFDGRRLADATRRTQLAQIKAFASWCVRNDRLDDENVAKIELPRVETRVRTRRALTLDESERLLQAARQGPTFGVMRPISGEDRYFAYLLALNTGLRLQELIQLTPDDFYLADPQEAYARLTASMTKNRKAVDILLPRELVEPLRAYLAGRDPARSVWRISYHWSAEMVRRDLAEAGVPVKVKGAVADFHALRHTFVTRLADAGTPPAVLQQLARHADVRLTLQCYTHTEQSHLREAVEGAVIGGVAAQG